MCKSDALVSIRQNHLFRANSMPATDVICGLSPLISKDEKHYAEHASDAMGAKPMSGRQKVKNPPWISVLPRKIA